MKTTIEISDKVISDELADLRERNRYVNKRFDQAEKELNSLRRLRHKYNSFIERNSRFEKEWKSRDLELDKKEERIDNLQKKLKEEMKKANKTMKIAIEDLENHWVFFDEHSTGEL